MASLKSLILLITAFPSMCCSSLTVGKTVRIDGKGLDWEVVGGAVLGDATGDTVRNGPDLAGLAVTHDFGNLYLKICYGEVPPPEASNLKIYLDTDDNRETGFSYLEAGIDLIWDFPSGSGQFPSGRNSSPGRGEFMVRSAYDSGTGILEMAFDLGLLENASWGKSIRLVVWDPKSLDHVPNIGEEAFTYTFTSPTQSNHPETSLEPVSQGDLRILTWNVLKDNPMKPQYADGFGRVLAAIDADIICFQEFYDASNAWIREFLGKWQPLPAGQFWWVLNNHDCVTASRYPVIFMKEVDNNLITEIDTTGIIGKNSWILNAHTPPHAENEAGRLLEADHFMSLLRHRMQEQNLSGDESFAIFLVGDMNTGGPLRSVLSMVEGDFHDEYRYGTGFDPDWDYSGLRDAAPMAIGQRSLTTWRSLGNRDSTARLDYILYSDSNVFLSKKFVLDTRNVGTGFLDQYNLKAPDTDGSDHLPVVADFRDTKMAEEWHLPFLDGSGWLKDAWIGDVYMRYAPFIYSSRHGWLYVQDLENSIWFFDYSNGWIWTSKDCYPMIYNITSNTWTWWLAH